MFSFGRADLGVIDGETFDFSQLEEYINDDSQNNIYFPDALVTSSDLKLTDVGDKAFVRGLPKDGAAEATEGLGQGLGGRCAVQLPGDDKAFALHHSRAGAPSFTKPHRLPDSPPDSGSEPPFSPPNEEPNKLKCSPVELLPHPELEGLKYLGYGHLMQPSLRPPSSASPHLRQHAPGSPVHSTHSASMPVLSPLQMPPFNPLQPMMGTHLYTGSEDFLYDNLANPVSSTTHSKKRKFTDSPKMSRNHQNNCIQVKVEPSGRPSPDPLVLPSGGEEEYDLGDSNSGMLVDSSFQCIRFQPFQQNTWAQLLDQDMNEIPGPQYRVDADKGFNFSNADESFVCQKKNHFQVTVHVQPAAAAAFVRTPDHGTRPVERFALHFHGVKMESPTQTIKVEQSQSDRSKRPFHPVPVELLAEQVTKTTVGRLHFSETTSNNMRKKGKPNPDQRFFFLVVSLCAHARDVPPATIVAHASEKIIVRASNPGQFENDMELSWQKGTTQDSIFHNGRVGINTDRPEESLVVHGNIKVTGHILQPSDLRAKYDIHELDPREQLRNVSQLRIVRYRYLPGLVREGDSTGEAAGVIAQELRRVIPDAVLEAGDMVLEDGRRIDKLLVVNKERLFMENVGAVKELCRVTDNLETRIDELERINRKLCSITRRKDSLKSTADLSRANSVLSKKRCHRTCSKRHREPPLTCSSHFIQSSIIVLVVIMFCCLIFLATLNIMEWQRRRGSTHVRISLPIQTKSSSEIVSPTNSTFRASTLSALSPALSSADDSISTSGSPPKRKFPPPHEDDPLLGHDPDCAPDDCPVYCCGSHEWEDTSPLHFHVQKKSGAPPIDHTFPPKLGLKESSSRGRAEKPHKLEKRSIADPDDEDSGQIFKTDDHHSDLELHLLELNATLLPELCSSTSQESSSAVFIFCHVYISRHFPHPNITLQIGSDEGGMAVEYCGGQHYMSCPHEVLPEEKSHDIHKRRAGSQGRSFQLSVGSFLASRYRLRMMTQRMTTGQQICSLGPNFHPFVEYVITFQRRCDK